jgi:hypothetical protein
LASVRNTIIILSCLSLLAGCTVVPDPTASQTGTADSDSALIGAWTAKITTNGTVFIHQLSLSSRWSYLRTVHDSTPGTSTVRHLGLQEDGTWKAYRTGDSAWLVLTPRFRQINSLMPAILLPDTASWSLTSGGLHWNAKRWNRRDTTEALEWTAN